MIRGRVTKNKPERARRFVVKPKVCVFCVEKVAIDYKDTVRLRKYISDRGKVEPRRRTGVCARHQRRLSLAIKRARFLALLPYTPAHFIPVEWRGEVAEIKTQVVEENRSAEENISTQSNLQKA
jgi:small subunit ribosomal protein S18